MSMSNEQWKFLQDVGELISFAKEKGYKLTGGELYRPKSMQILYFKGLVVELANGFAKLAVGRRLTKVLDSQHQKRLAIDLNIFYDIDNDGDDDYFANLGSEQQEEVVKPLADYWCSLDPKNTCGFKWGWDLGHFERKS